MWTVLPAVRAEATIARALAPASSRAHDGDVVVIIAEGSADQSEKVKAARLVAETRRKVQVLCLEHNQARCVARDPQSPQPSGRR